ncbi:hypothetical protein FMM05_19585, partial [Flavobacterium zepuense]
MKLYYWLLAAVFIIFPTTLRAQVDCPDAIMVCGDGNYSGLDATGVGIQEININNACSSMENNSLWLKILIKDGGTLGFILTPESDNLVVDFDFWIFGPNVNCGNLGTAIRCSTTNPLQAGLTYNTTGMNAQSADVSEGPGTDGNSFINWMNVQDGDIYYIVIDRPVGASNFSMEWTGTATFHDVPEFLNPDNIPLEIVKCDADGVDDGSTAFDLTIFEQMFIGSQTPVQITYHLNNNDMITGDDPIESPEAFDNGSDPQVIYMRITNIITGCYSNETLTISLTPPIEGGEPEDLTECDVNGNGFALFNLDANEAAIKDGNSECAVTYFTSQQNAINNTGAINVLYQNTIAYGPQTIWTRLEKTNGCVGYDISSFTITVLPLPEFNNPNNIDINLSQCDDDEVDDQSVAFDLTVYENMFIGSQSSAVVTYFTDEALTNQINTPEAFANTSNPQTIYAVLTNTQTECFETISFTIQITNPVTAGEPEDLTACDQDEDGFTLFNLTLNDDAIKNGNTQSIVTYYTSQQNAEEELGALSSPYQNEVANTQTIWARVDSTTGCYGYALTSFTLNMLPLPQFENTQANTPLVLYRCDDDGLEDQFTDFDLTQYNTLLTGSQTNVQFSFYETEAFAIDGINAIQYPNIYINTSSPQTVYIRIDNVLTGCFNVMPLNLEIVTPPVAYEVPALQECDFNNDGFAEFNLDAVIASIEATMPNVVVTLHETQPDADFGTNDITETAEYDNVYINTQTLYIRVQSAFSDCYDTTTLQLILNPVPEAITPAQPYRLCDNGDVDTDGIAIFDLTSLEDEVFGGMDPALFSVSYFLSYDAAVLGMPAIASPASYATVNTIIYIRVTNNATGCYDIVQVNLVVNPLPVAIQPEPYTLCDVNNPGDEIEVFDLTTRIDEITQGMLGVDVTFYHTYTDAAAGTNVIPEAETFAYSNSPAVETIFVRVTDAITGCFRIVLQDVRVVPLPIILEPTPEDLTVCDTNGEGIGSINLDDLVQSMTNNGPYLEISFFWTEEDAQNNINEIPNTDTLQNLDPFVQFIYVRVEHTETHCFRTYQLTLIVAPAPQAPQLPDIVECDDDNQNQNGMHLVDLTVNQQVIYDAVLENGETEDSLIIHYFTTEANADAGMPWIPTPTNYNASNNQTIWVRVEDAVTECYSLT